MSYEILFLRALGTTVAIETVVLGALCLRFGPRPVQWGRVVAAGILASSGTLPYLWFVLPPFITYRMALIVIGEILVTLLEMPVLRYVLPVPWGKAALFSVICNAASMGLGLLIFK
jgi:hypothetical protein